MTQAGISASDDGSVNSRSDVSSRLARLVLLSRCVLGIERVARAAFFPLLLVALFLGVSFLDIWHLVPAWVRMLALVCFGGAFVYSLKDFFHLSWPSKSAALARLEGDEAGPLHRPLTALEDNLSLGGKDEVTMSLWALHQRRMSAALAKIRVRAPSPDVSRKDPYGLRVVVGVLLIVGWVAAQDSRWDRVSFAFSSPFEDTQAVARLDAWVTPPLYTDKPPVFLTGESAQLRDPQMPISIPQGSVLVVRSQGREDVTVTADIGTLVREDGGAGEAEKAVAGDKAKASAEEEHYVINETTQVSLMSDDETLMSWSFDVIADDPPTIRLNDDPERQLSGALKLSYVVSDDYGVVSARAHIEPANTGDLAPEGARPLVEAPDFPLSLPPAAGTAKSAETIRDLSSHPWAGSKVDLVLSALDEAEQKGESEPFEFELPQRVFSKLLARAVVEQRRDLALDARNHVRVLTVFDALLLAPEVFDVSTKDYLGLTFAYSELERASTDDELRELLPLLWDLALTIEDGDLSLAERALREAQQALRQALENGASDEDIAKLTEELRKALDQYMQALAEQLMKNPQSMQQQLDQQQQQMSRQDLNEMLDRIEELAKTGAKDAARELLAQMQQMLENLQAGRPQMRPNQSASEMMQSLNELSDLIQRQKRLMDDTNELNRERRQGTEKSQQQGDSQGEQSEGSGSLSDQEMADMLKSLQQQQGDLEQELQALMERLQQQGMEQEGDLGKAGEEMGKAQGSLGRGEGDQAVGEQGNALDALRKGAQGMADQMMGGQQKGTGLARGRAPLDEDPLGRPRRTERTDFGDRVKVPDEIDVQRARKILEELRRRFSDPSRPPLELDYLDRLLDRF
ncbi:MAG: TIGR02302 family protein [Rhodobacteraceae bacterium]|nr:TIGR02302 family protein [Paracoccaceae bacterium]